jgi:hypothetical protein
VSTEQPRSQPPSAAEDTQAIARVRVETQLGIAPRTLEEGWRLAQLMAKSSIVPEAFRNHPEDTLVAIQLGIEVGLAPMSALQSIAVINGRPGLWGDGFLGVIISSPYYVNHREVFILDDGTEVDDITHPSQLTDALTASCTFWRRNKPEPTTRTFSVLDAKRAKKKDRPLWGSPGPWTDYPARMLRMRARGWAGRDTFPDVLRGIKPVEELLDYDESPPPVERPTPRRVVKSARPEAEPPKQPSTEQPARPAQAPTTEEPKPATRIDERPLTHVDVTEGLEPPEAPPAEGTTVKATHTVTVRDKTWYVVELADGLRAYTWDRKLYELAQHAEKVGASVKPHHVTTTFRAVPEKLTLLEVL